MPISACDRVLVYLMALARRFTNTSLNIEA
ncbi:MAG: hypothetical protein JWQ71_4069, partial [Pedosphaera sp.]|nr:hypothetical protein [Pedosphaera sp.]